MELQLVEGDGGRVRDAPLALVVGQLPVDGLNVVEEHGRVDGVVRAVLHAAAVPSVQGFFFDVFSAIPSSELPK